MVSFMKGVSTWVQVRFCAYDCCLLQKNPCLFHPHSSWKSASWVHAVDANLIQTTISSKIRSCEPRYLSRDVGPLNHDVLGCGSFQAPMRCSWYHDCDWSITTFVDSLSVVRMTEFSWGRVCNRIYHVQSNWRVPIEDVQEHGKFLQSALVISKSPLSELLRNHWDLSNRHYESFSFDTVPLERTEGRQNSIELVRQASGEGIQKHAAPPFQIWTYVYLL